MLTHQTSDYPPSYLQKLPYFSSHLQIHHATLFTSDRRQSKTLIISTNVSQKSLETEFSNAICCSTVDKWQTKTLFLTILEPRSSIVKSVFDCRLSGVLFPILSIHHGTPTSHVTTKLYVMYSDTPYESQMFLYQILLYNI